MTHMGLGYAEKKPMEAYMKEERLPVSMGAVRALKELLVSSGGPHKEDSEERLREILLEGVNRIWSSSERSDSDMFMDNRGGGYLIDLSPWLRGVMVHAVVRDVNGQVGVVDVVDDADVEELRKSGAVPSETTEEHRRNLFPRRPFQPVVYSGPYLVRWQMKKDEESPSSSWEQEKVSPDNVAEKVQALAAKGVVAQDIEIWTTMKRPQVNVVLV